MEETERMLSAHQRWRGVVKASIARLKDLESDTSHPAIVNSQLKLNALDVEC